MELDLLAALAAAADKLHLHLLLPLLPLLRRRAARAARAAREHLHQLLVHAPSELLRAAASELHHLRTATAT